MTDEIASGVHSRFAHELVQVVVFYDDFTITRFRLIGRQNVFKLSLTFPQSTSKLYGFTSQKKPHSFSLIQKSAVTKARHFNSNNLVDSFLQDKNEN